MANTKHAVVRTDALSGTSDSTKLASVIFYDGDNAAAIDNAQLVVLGDMLSRNVYKATAPVAASARKDIYLTAGEELFYDQTIAHYLTEWENSAEKSFRCYYLPTYGGFSATAEAFDGTPEVGKYAGFAAGSTKIVVKDAADGNTIGKITDSDVTGYGEGRYEYFYVSLC